jgi:iron complex outermembrane receptor protein
LCQRSSADWDHTLTRQYVIDNEKLQNFSVDTQLQSKFATADVDHTLLTGVDFMRMRNDINSWFGYAGSVAPSDIYNPTAATSILAHTQALQVLTKC